MSDLPKFYAVQRIMQDSSRDQPTIVAVLCAFVRDHANAATVKSAHSSTSPAPGQVPTDIQAAYARDADEAYTVAELAAFGAAQARDLTDDEAGKILELATAAEAADNWLTTIAHDQLTRKPRWSGRLRQRIHPVATRHARAAEQWARQVGRVSDTNVPSP
jgi:hypothetical protein